jgi:hypothetical protein
MNQSQVEIQAFLQDPKYASIDFLLQPMNRAVMNRSKTREEMCRRLRWMQAQ